MDSIIVYGSQYGTARRYAEKFAEMTGFPAAGYRERPDLSGYRRVILFGGLYAGGVLGLRETAREVGGQAELLIATVGLADVADPRNIANIRKAARRQLPAAAAGRVRFFHLRGGIDYQKLSFKHRTMMTLLYHKAKNLPPEKQDAEVRAMIETFGKKVDFVDFQALSPLLEAIRETEGD